VWNFFCPKVIFGEEALSFLAELGGKRALILTDQNLVKLGLVEKVKKFLQIETLIFDQIEAEPSYLTADQAKELILQKDCDLIVGLGGGSVLDVAKTARILAENPELEIEEITPLSPIQVKKRKLILIPTTTGSGSEVTTAIVLKNKEGRKTPTINSAALADFAILDPSLIENLPPGLVAQTGIDALCHSIDAFLSEWKNDFSDGLAIFSLKLIFENLISAYQGKKEAKKKMQYGATLAGLAFGNSQAGLSHTLGHSLGAVFNLPHGRACGICLPYSLQFLIKNREVEKLLKDLIFYLKIDSLEEFLEKIFDLLSSLSLPSCLREEKISAQKFNQNLEKLVEFCQLRWNHLNHQKGSGWSGT